MSETAVTITTTTTTTTTVRITPGRLVVTECGCCACTQGHVHPFPVGHQS